MHNLDRFIASCRSWDDFYERTKKLSADSEKGAVFERLTQLYLQTTPEYRGSHRASLILEEGETRLKPGQVVIQRGTNHAWQAHGGPALFLAVLIDRESLTVSLPASTPT